jgi:hypothetical protein
MAAAIAPPELPPPPAALVLEVVAAIADALRHTNTHAHAHINMQINSTHHRVGQVKHQLHQLPAM